MWAGLKDSPPNDGLSETRLDGSLALHTSMLDALARRSLGEGGLDVRTQLVTFAPFTRHGAKAQAQALLPLA